MTSTEFTVDAAERANKVFGFDAAGELVVSQELGTYRGNWTSGTAYKQRDIIKDTSNANIYICITAHTASGSQPISSNADVAKWALIVDAASAAAAQAAAEAAQAAAETAQAAAETAQGLSEDARDAALAAQSAAEDIFTQFGDQYLGAFATDPTVDNSGNALTTGDIYFNTADNVLKFYSGAAWVAPEDVATTAAADAAASATEASGYADDASGFADDAAASAALAATYTPDQTGNSGKFLTTDGTVTSWAVVDALPDQTGNAGKYLTTDGTDPSWETLDTDANSTTKGLYEHSNTIAANYTIGSGNNAMSAGTVTLGSGITVTVPSGSRWVIV
jgi:hypothetical protein